ncbi:MAG: NADH-quinone oxidoreductase subunit C [Chloroflexi bacterium]|nr:NADH-quinone oxidoreductase subunit C [Chloroflexota bacterium]
MDKALKSAIKDINKRFEAQETEFRGLVSLVVAPEHIVQVCSTLREKHHFEMLSSQTAVDYWPQEKPRFHLIYQFNSYAQKARLEVRVPLDGDSPVVNSVVSVFPNANWHEREIWDLFGIRFEGHPDLRRILMPHDWEGYPLRKDYPLGYEEVQFTFNYDEINRRKPKPKDY